VRSRLIRSFCSFRYKIFDQLPLYEMKELLEDIEAYKEAEADGEPVVRLLVFCLAF
jgi:hypothetical protein